MIDLPPQLKYFYDKSLESFQRKHYDYALEMSKAVIKQAPHYVPAYELAYRSASHLKKIENRNFLRGLFSLIKANYFRILAGIHLLNKKVDRAHWYIVQGLTEAPSDHRLLKNWLDLSMKQGWLDTAIIPAKALCETNPKRIDGFIFLSSLYLKKGAVDHAKSAIQKGLMLHPADPQLTRRLKEIEAEKTMQRGDWGGKNS